MKQIEIITQLFEKKDNERIVLWSHIFELAQEKRVLITKATSKGSGKPAHMCSLARAFAVHRYVVETYKKLQAKKIHV